MAYVSFNYLTNPKAPMGKWVGDKPYYGECVSYVKAVVPTLPQTRYWTKGKPVRGDAGIVAGTVIATFDAAGKYKGHAAIYEAQTAEGINVVDQWMTPPPQPIHKRVLRFGASGNVNNGDNYFIVE